MTAFLIAAALLIAVVLAILVPPLWRRADSTAAGDRREINLAILRDQLAELDNDRAAGSLAEADYLQARDELQRRLLDEVDASPAVTGTVPGGRRAAIALLIIMPLGAAAGYALLGEPRALDPLQRQARMAPEQIERMVSSLAERLRKNPEDSQGWVMLARSYKVLERYPEAAEAYGRAGMLVEQDPGMLADYADVLARTTGSVLGRPAELAERALRSKPDEPQALLLAGAAASERQQFAAAADYWTRLLAQLEPDSDEARELAGAVSRARELAAQQPTRPPIDSARLAAGAVSGEVLLSGRLAGKAGPDDTVFIFARAEDGSRMPLAATRARVADLPLRFRLDDSMALGNGRMADSPRVTIEARVARAGQTRAASGDLYGRLGGVKPGSRDLRLVIDQVQP
ncbi:c-type cytochrome biogenesis protein CcmI [Accumulibacter sp.]|uniref:c-type cytochrome biogenesis protein CcmI n=1 Tax=Accumulibacter sp. TaxID=2053492 RepID=UPI0025E76F11|nr:c-type cytochrome biogenesis protein CcmI [Accumulibacter sp.]MCM8595227.1 c-type cytochrome biogenesis protein CcmI [Accumulibacter sp.]MCM8626860.1 c-type cytochrome biogenesis protein CcmI [Accumulibacter sp.]MDS4049373.1 c-type cytochrome biogenesis protein CcmI [Accumulibacter sp.]